MPTVNITFLNIIANPETFGDEDDEHITSQVFFYLSIGDRRFPNLHVDLKQAVGASFKDAPLEISRPVGYTGPLDCEALY